jgi:transposase-like protein
MGKKKGVPAGYNCAHVEPFVKKWLNKKEYPKEIQEIRTKLMKALKSAIERPSDVRRFSSHRINQSSNFLTGFLENIAAEHTVRANNCLTRWWREQQKKKALNKIDLMRDELSQEIKELVERQRKQEPEAITLEANLDYLADKILSSLIGTSYKQR